MYEWQQQIQLIVDEIDACIKAHDDEALTLRRLAQKLGYSEFYTTRKFKEISGLSLRDYLRQRKLAFALKEVRDGDKVCWISRLTMAFLRTKPLPARSKVCTASRPALTASSLSPSFCGPRSFLSTATF